MSTKPTLDGATCWTMTTIEQVSSQDDATHGGHIPTVDHYTTTNLLTTIIVVR